MLYSGGTVSHQNAAVYLHNQPNIKEDSKETTDGPKKVEPVGQTTPYNADAFFKLWDEQKPRIIGDLERKLGVAFDYIFKDDHSILAYIKPADKASKQIKSTKILGYNPIGQIRVVPITDSKDDVVRKVTVQARYNQYGMDFNKRTINLVTPDYSVDELVEQIVETAFSLTKVLNIL